MIQTFEFNEEVLFSTADITMITREDIAFLKERAAKNPRKRIRLCAHSDIGHSVHEMLIVQCRGIYIRPHRHLGKSESFHVIEGLVDVVFFRDDGSIREILKMGDYRSDKVFYYRVEESIYHSLVIESEFFVFHETGGGPFNRRDTEFAPWAPEEDDAEAANDFLRHMRHATNIGIEL